MNAIECDESSNKWIVTLLLTSLTLYLSPTNLLYGHQRASSHLTYVFCLLPCTAFGCVEFRLLVGWAASGSRILWLAWHSFDYRAARLKLTVVRFRAINVCLSTSLPHSHHLLMCHRSSLVRSLPPLVNVSIFECLFACMRVVLSALYPLSWLYQWILSPPDTKPTIRG